MGLKAITIHHAHITIKKISYYIMSSYHIIFVMIQSQKLNKVKSENCNQNSKNNKTQFSCSKRRQTPYVRPGDKVSIVQ